MDPQFDLDLAALALKGKRFKEAEQAYTTIAREQNSSVAWCGMAVSKFGQILEKGATIEEIFFCFGKATAANPDEISTIEKLSLQTSYDVIANLYSLYVNVYNIGKAATKQQSRAVFTGIVGAVGGLSSKTLYGSIASAGLTAISYDSYIKGSATVEEIKSQLNHIQNIIKEIINQASCFILIEKSELDNFIILEAELGEKVLEQINPAAKRQLEAEKQLRIKDEKIKYELVNPEHPFNKYKAEASSAFKAGLYKEAYDKSWQALIIFSSDDELKQIRISSAKKIKEENAKGCGMDILIFLIVVGILGFILEREGDLPQKYFYILPLLLVGIIIRAVQRSDKLK